MQSKNKASMTKAEREHVTRIKEMPCGVCSSSGPTEAHELRQGERFTAIPLCPDCHRGPFNGIHGQARIWSVYKRRHFDSMRSASYNTAYRPGGILT